MYLSVVSLHLSTLQIYPSTLLCYNIFEIISNLDKITLMKKEQKANLIKYSKIMTTIIAVSLWIYAIYTISQSDTPFRDQAPYCMGTTMLIFMILSGIYKALDYIDKN